MELLKKLNLLSAFLLLHLHLREYLNPIQSDHYFISILENLQKIVIHRNI